MVVSLFFLRGKHEGVLYTSIEDYRPMGHPAAKLVTREEGDNMTLSNINKLVETIYRIAVLVKMLLGFIPL